MAICKKKGPLVGHNKFAMLRVPGRQVEQKGISSSKVNNNELAVVCR